MKLHLPSLAILGFLMASSANAMLLGEEDEEVCEIQKSQKEIECPVVPPPKLPKTCSGMSASWWGDPHFTTFNGKKYDCMGEGEFDIVRSATKPDFALQGRFRKANVKSRKRPTVTRAIAFQTGDGEPRIQIDVPDNFNPKAGGCPATVYIDGKEQTLGSSEFIAGANSTTGIHIQETKSPDLCIPDCALERGEKFMGMLGTPDDDKDNEWIRRNYYDEGGHGVVPFKGRRDSKAEYKYCVQNWCLNDPKDSLFKYPPGKSFKDYDNCKLPPYDENNDCSNMDEIKQICGADNRECIVDGCAQGVEAAKEAVRTALEMVDKKCGKEIFFEDFDKDDYDYSGWGLVKDKASSKHKGAEMATKYLNLNQAHPKVEASWDSNGAKLVLLEFNLYEIGSWDAGKSADKFLINVGDVEIDIGAFDGRRQDVSRDGVVEGIDWSVNALSAQTDLGFGLGQKLAPQCAAKWGRCYGKGPGMGHWPNGKKCCPSGFSCQTSNNKHWQCNPNKRAKGPTATRQAQAYTVKVAVPGNALVADGGMLKLALKTVFSSDITNESAGIDNLRLTGYHSTCSFDCQGTTVISETFDEEEAGGDAASWGSTKELSDGHVVLGPVYSNTKAISKAFEVSETAGAATIDFFLYEMGVWAAMPSNKFLVTIGDTQFDLGPFTDDDDDDTPTKALVQDHVGDDNTLFWERKELDAGGRTTEGGNGAVHKVSIQVSNQYFPDGILMVGFDVDSQDDQGVSAAIDDFKIRLYPEADRCQDLLVKKADNNPTTAAPTTDSPTTAAPTTNSPTTESPMTASPTTAAPATAAPTTESPTSAPPTTDSPTTSNPSTLSPSTEVPSTVSPTTEIPKVKTPKKGSSSGDPHFKTWHGVKFDYHGECDLVLVDHPSFANGKGLRVHIRTTRVKYFSYIERIALQIGDDILEFGNDVDNFFINGAKVDSNRKHHKTMFGGYMVRRDRKAISVRLDEEAKAKIDFHTRKNGFPAVIVDAGKTDLFAGSLGLLGQWHTGNTMARDGVTEIELLWMGMLYILIEKALTEGKLDKPQGTRAIT
ncbi:Calcium-binding EGF domain [Seminavis robusta]|uniref:Calcium-binding EGF domain n=1 Tax=Seminavis robusta TaxID=568900 RepID=A0A9N8EM50_9STRA|nr:Calcium-binding EGF domain [Seminavis robusta]|eukprot:Sro1521_g279490.1 Calcium-binding EGF domain (1050) ;mRNA; f:14316-18145